MDSFVLPEGYPSMPGLHPGSVASSLHWHERIRAGVPVSLFYALTEPGLLPRATLAKVVFGKAVGPRNKLQLLEIEQANVLYRVLQAVSGVTAAFKGDTKRAVTWLSTPRPELRGRVPLALSGTPMGMEYARTAIERIRPELQ